MNLLKCDICERGCRLSEGHAGFCMLYEQRDGRIIERFPDRYLVACPISIETAPMLHYYPGGKFFQISTTGCNLNCPGCISTVIVQEMPPESAALSHMTPQMVVDCAFREHSIGIIFLMNDPLASFHTFLKVASLAKAQGLLVGCASNTCFTEQALARLLPNLDFINIGMKGFSDRAYRDCYAPSIKPVLRNMKILHDQGIHVEVSCVYKKENARELGGLADYIAGISKRIPLQVMRFIPFEGADISQEPSIREAESLCEELKQRLDFVYLFNSPGTRRLNTYCPECGEKICQRDFYGPMGAKLRTVPSDFPENGLCAACRHPLPFRGSRAEGAFQEGDFEGGYPFTRALEMVEAMVIAMGIRQKSKVVRAWETLLSGDGLKKLHKNIQQPESYIDTLRHFGRVVGATPRAETLARYLEAKLSEIRHAVAPVRERPRVYYAMGTPLFYLNAGRMENHLVEIAGGISVNRELTETGRPGRTISADQLNALNPEVIFISAFISNSVEDFYEDCLRLCVNVTAVRERRIYTHPAPGWDFGSPRWILGLMYIASVLHPTAYPVDVIAEAQAFYRDFYDEAFSPEAQNRSFSKPTNPWRWEEETESLHPQSLADKLILKRPRR
jgi:pyruvate formate lyase activating enzyme